MSGEWKAALTWSATTFFAPARFASSDARATASGVPESTTWPGLL